MGRLGKVLRQRVLNLNNPLADRLKSANLTMTILSDEELHQRVPAAFAQEPASHTSARYSFIPTTEIINQLRDRGWHPVRAYQSHRADDKVHARHMITFRNRTPQQLSVGDVLPEVCLVNAHNALSRFRFLAGLFRLACSNGMVVSTGVAETNIERIHIDGNGFPDIQQAMLTALKRLGEADQAVQQWSKLDLDLAQRIAFANAAILIRNKGDRHWSKHFDAHNFLQTRRHTDKGTDLWTVFNVVQENVIRGGVRGASGYLRPINEVSENVRINSELWQLANTTASGLN